MPRDGNSSSPGHPPRRTGNCPTTPLCGKGYVDIAHVQDRLGVRCNQAAGIGSNRLQDAAGQKPLLSIDFVREASFQASASPDHSESLVNLQ